MKTALIAAAIIVASLATAHAQQSVFDGGGIVRPVPQPSTTIIIVPAPRPQGITPIR